MKLLKSIAAVIALGASPCFAQSSPNYVDLTPPKPGALSAAQLKALATSKADVTNGQLTNPIINGGTQSSPQLITPSLTLDGTARPATGWLATSRPADKNVFIGGTGVNYCPLMGVASNLPQTLAMGNIGLYQHANGNAACTSAQRTAIWSTWAGTGVVSGAGQSVGEVGGFATLPTNYLSFFGGAYPNEANMNALTNSGDGTGTYTAGAGDKFPGTVYTGYVTAGDLANLQTFARTAIASGTKNVANFISPNGGGEDLDDPFATAPYWANVRAAALYNGGIALDTPPTYFFNRTPPYRSMIAQMISWAVSQGLRVSMTVSPFALVADASGNTGACGFDPVMMENTTAMVGYLKSQGVWPTQWVVENYGGGAPCTSNDIQPDGTPESLNAVALFLARATKTTAPGATAPGVPGGLADAGLMAPTAAVPAISASLSSARTGPLRLADILGFGDMAGQDSANVQISGGNIVGPINLSLTVTPLFQTGIHIQGTGGATTIAESTVANTIMMRKAASTMPVTLDMSTGTIEVGSITGPTSADRPAFPNGITMIGGSVSAHLTSSTTGDVVVGATNGNTGLVYPSDTFGGLTTPCVAASTRYVVGLRNTGEAAGAGTGAIAYCTDALVWFANGAPVTH